MKKLIGYIGTYVCYWIGDIFCKICSWKIYEEYFWDNYFENIGMFLVNQYQNFMNWSSNIQDWSKIDGPWKEITNQEKYINDTNQY